MAKTGRRIDMPPLRGFEIEDVPATVLPIPPEKDTFVVSQERMTPGEMKEMAQPVSQPPLHASEEPDSAVHVIHIEPDEHPEEPDWGGAKKMPEIHIPRGKLLRPWDD